MIRIARPVHFDDIGLSKSSHTTSVPHAKWSAFLLHLLWQPGHIVLATHLDGFGAPSEIASHPGTDMPRRAERFPMGQIRETPRHHHTPVLPVWRV
jgi:hypothetical protein